ncbi:Anti-sigma regulatory factor (Ser/Thr protein kinase) [Roseateles sp. YR242]|uniref:SpoIIE family protein phosphatase n=1 Tax=Roseateles sp. YR242 TaxID=1855305 RepID=UPI0008B1FA12|nr:SpoIIE family protein phosphatase [Roseateles sp. YR242]SEL18092.1 Anti-sigma regulatory factor (Ser/Thr protein kinase) [Roseateles sp. YR242]
MRPHQRFPIEDVSQVGEARRAANGLALELGFDEAAAGRLALIVTELGTNLHRHVGPGRQCALLVASVDDEIEILSLDLGDGMDVARCLQDGYSTGGSSGTGLGAVRRMARRFGAFSAPGRGTVIAVRAAAGTKHGSPTAPSAAPSSATSPAFDVAGVTLPAPGETVSGDAWTVRVLPDHWLLLVADGLGHGVAAAEASDRMVELLHQAPPAASPAGSPAAILDYAHERLRATRGAAVTLARMDAAQPQLLFAGAGNVSGRLISGVSDRTLMAQHGTLGLQVRRLQDIPYDWPPHAVFILHSDGIQTRWKLDDTPGLLQSDPAVIAGWILRDHCRGRDDATVVVARRSFS